MNSREVVRQAMVAALGATGSDGTVVALTGAWGSGKTHLWREVAETLRARSLLTAYTSLFGLTTVAEVKAAVVNDTLLGGAIQEGKLKRLFGWGAKQLPGLLKALDNKIGFELLTRSLDLTRLIEAGTVVCLDDLERIPESMRVEDILGLAGYLADQRGARVLLISNDEHVKQKHEKYETLVRAYRERVVRLSFRLEPSVPEILPSLSIVTESAVLHRFLPKLTAFAERSRVTNVRTLIRILERVRLLKDAYSIELPPEFSDFLCALVVEETEGNLRDFDLYDLNPILFAFEKHLRQEDEPEPSEEQICRKRFFNRHFAASGEFFASRAIYDFVCNGYPDPERMRQEIADRLGQGKRTAVQHALEPWKENHHANYSDAELRAWVGELMRVLSDQEDLSPGQCIECYAAASHASEMLSTPVPDEVLQAASRKLVALADKGDASLEKEIRRGTLSKIPVSMVSAYTTALSMARSRGMLVVLVDAVRRRDLDSLQEQVQNSRVLDAELIAIVLRELEGVRSDSRGFYFDSIFTLAGACGPVPELRGVLKAYLQERLSEEDIDESDRWRFRRILRTDLGEA